jgi:hypothetical protein
MKVAPERLPVLIYVFNQAGLPKERHQGRPGPCLIDAEPARYRRPIARGDRQGA